MYCQHMYVCTYVWQCIQYSVRASTKGNVCLFCCLFIAIGYDHLIPPILLSHHFCCISRFPCLCSVMYDTCPPVPTHAYNPINSPVYHTYLSTNTVLAITTFTAVSSDPFFTVCDVVWKWLIGQLGSLEV